MSDETTTEDVTTQDAGANTQQETTEEFVFDAWFGEQDERVKGGIEDHIRGLKSALESERTSKTTLEKRVRTLTNEAAAGSDLRKELEKLGSDLADSNAKAYFFKSAHEARLIDLELGWLAAKNGGLLNSKGEVDMRALREAHPALFAPAKQVAPPAHQGNGRSQEIERKPNFNDAIRAAARG